MEMAFLQSSIDSGLLHTPSQEVPQNLIGIKRKVVSENLPDQAPPGNDVQKQLPEQLQYWWAPLQLRQTPLQQFQNHHSLKHLQNQKPSLQWLNDRQLPTQKLEYRPTFPEHMQNRWPLFRYSQGQQLLVQQSGQQPLLNQIGSFWCNICKVNCGNAFNLKCHFHGKKHKAKWDEVFGCKTTVPNGNEVKRRKNTRQYGSNNSAPSYQITSFWCNLCKVNCGNSFNLDCHFQGKKHKAKCEEVCGSKNTIPDGNEANGSKNTIPLKPSLSGIKQEAVSENLPGVFDGSQDQRLPPKKLQDWWVPLQLLQLRQTSWQQLQNHQTPMQLLQLQKPSPQDNYQINSVNNCLGRDLNPMISSNLCSDSKE